MIKTIQIPETLKIISNCWVNAELKVLEYSADLPSSYEETITELLYRELKINLKNATKEKLLEKAFCSDLKKVNKNLSTNDLRGLIKGFGAKIIYHPRSVEEKTGGDMGLIIIRPQMINNRFVNHQQGLLCQIKRRSKTGKWGHLSENQKEIFNPTPDYLVLLLYSFLKNHNSLNPFDWQLCKGFELKEIESWFKTNGVFPTLINSKELIHQLGEGHIGTGDEKIIKEKIISSGTQNFQIKIGWPDGSGPDPKILLNKHKTCSQQVHQKISIYN